MLLVDMNSITYMTRQVTELTVARAQLQHVEQSKPLRKVIYWIDNIDAEILKWVDLLDRYKEYHIDIDEPLNLKNLHMTIEENRM